ncbi:MAG: hypothetical protein ACK5D9_12465 [Burkholderiales bacterium]
MPSASSVADPRELLADPAQNTATPKLGGSSATSSPPPATGAGSRALLPFPMMAKAAQKKDMEKILDKALKRPDCKEVYSDLGMLVVVPLLRDAAKGSGCKW